MAFLENFFGVLALVTSIIGLIPQIYKSYKTKSTEDVSMIMLINYLVCSVCWIVYGFYNSSVFVIYSNIVGLITSSIAVWQKYNYDRKDSK